MIETSKAQKSERKKSLHQRSTSLLHKIMSKLQSSREYDQIETIFYSWDEISPLPNESVRYRGILCIYYANALTQQQKFTKVIDLFKIRSETEAEQLLCSLSYKLLESIFIACWHTRHSKLATDLFRKAEDLGLTLRERTYVHLVSAMVYDRINCDIRDILRIWRKMSTELGMTMPLFLQPLIILRAVESEEFGRAMQLYRLPSTKGWTLNELGRFRFEILFQALYEKERYAEILHIYSTLVQADEVPNQFKILMSRFLLNRSLLDNEYKHDVTSNDLDLALKVLELMHSMNIEIRPNRLYPLMYSTIRFGGTEYTTTDGKEAHFPCIQSVSDLLAFTEKYNGAIKWTGFFVSETLIVLAYFKRLEFIGELMEYALGTNIPVSYFALEAIISSLFQLDSHIAAERISSICSALLSNPEIAIGIRVTEIGIATNSKLGRNTEIIQLFEAFVRSKGYEKLGHSSTLLAQVRQAYSFFGREEEAEAVNNLLEHYRGHHDATASTRYH